MTSNKIDKASWRATVAHYRAWNEVEFLANVRNAGKKSVLQKWHEFLDLMEFGMQIKPQPSKHEQRQKMEMLNQYYQRIQRFEAWRQQHGNSSKKGAA
jgi:hypothetical protein